MLNDAMRRQALHDGLAVGMHAAVEGTRTEGDPGEFVNTWRGQSEALTLVLDGAAVEAMVADAVRWAERITLCVTAPHSERGSSPFWGELLARSTKCDRIYVRR